MNRKEIYEKIKKFNLQSIVEKECKENYTRVSNAKLESIITKYTTKATNTKKEENKSSCNKSNKCDKLIEILKKKHILLDSEVAYIYS